MEEAEYGGAVPHLYRHWALVHGAQKDLDKAGRDIHLAWKATIKSNRSYLRALIKDTWAKILVQTGNVDKGRHYFAQALREYRRCGLFQEPFSVVQTRIRTSLISSNAQLNEERPW